MSRRVIVVGAGSAGGVVAARLSEDPRYDVLLLEAGPDFPDERDAPDHVRYSGIWDVKTDWGSVDADLRLRTDKAFALGAAGDAIPLLRGKVVGGGSAVNGANAIRPIPSDFDKWVEAGNDRWTWDAVLPYLRKVERDPLGGEYHGTDGPIAIRRYGDSELRPLHRAFLEAAADAGHPVVEDINAPGVMGAGRLPLNQIGGIRQSTAVTYTRAARGRSNWTLRAHVEVDRIEMRGTRAVGVRLVDGTVIEADDVILCAGAFASPAILLRSGVGPADELLRIGVDVRVDLPHVGQHFLDQPFIWMVAETDPEAVGLIMPPTQSTLTLASDGSRDQRDKDIDFVPATVAPGQFVLGFGMVKPVSTGFIELPSADPTESLIIHSNLLGEDADVQRCVRAMRIGRELMAHESMRRFLGAELVPGEEADDDEALAAALRAMPTSYQHGSGTCRMGRGPEDSVVDQVGRVHGLENVSVIDASVMPWIPSSPTNIAVMAIAEKCVAESWFGQS